VTKIQPFKNFITWRIRLFLYLSSLSSLFFMQNYCTNICPFIDELRPEQITLNLFFVFIFHILFREMLFLKFNNYKGHLSTPRLGYYLSIVSWMFAGVVALSIHAIRYEHFPLGSHLKLLSTYWILGAGILAQLEYIVFDIRYKSILPKSEFTQYKEKISNRILESFFIFTIAPVLTLLLVIGRYSSQGVLDKHVLIESLYIGLFFVIVVTFVALFFGKLLKKDTEKIIESINQIKNGDFNNELTIVRSDELGEIAQAINSMRVSIKQGIEDIKNLNAEITDTQKEVVFTMGSIAETRSKETGNHVKRVAAYSELLALKYGLPKDEAKLLRLASPMHDIGKVAIPDSILNKPGRHTEDEFTIMKTHAMLGYEMLKHSKRDILKAAAIVAHQHHEKFDGTGYPRGIQGTDIHIYGRITAIADVFDALGSDRCYKKAWEDEAIFELLNANAGKHFDPELIKIFFNNFYEINKIRNTYKDL
jgi:response regulator RpfG family c-di-GMP phosphodiesterase